MVRRVVLLFERVAKPRTDPTARSSSLVTNGDVEHRSLDVDLSSYADSASPTSSIQGGGGLFVFSATVCEGFPQIPFVSRQEKEERNDAREETPVLRLFDFLDRTT
ncbi:hypothetical protein Droror1_Dr00001499 [Drosera rotundifolia]